MSSAVFPNLAYAPPEPPDSVGHLLDLYLPDGESRPSPLIVWSSGSAWLRDDGKHGAAAIAPFFTAAGYAVAGVSVRSSGQALFPAQLLDAKSAIRWLRTHAGDYGLDPERFAFMGDSSGGWLAVMAALTSGLPEFDGSAGVSTAVQVAVDFYGPTDFLQMDAHMPDDGKEFRNHLGIAGCHVDPKSPESRLVGGPIEARRAACARANPISYVRAGTPPMMILHGRQDPFVPHHQSELLYEALRAHGNEAVFYSIPDMGHERPYVSDPARAAGYVAISTRTSEVEHRPPTWETIETFISGAMATPRADRVVDRA